MSPITLTPAAGSPNEIVLKCGKLNRKGGDQKEISGKNPFFLLADFKAN
jgi:hypothetical protein